MGDRIQFGATGRKWATWLSLAIAPVVVCFGMSRPLGAAEKADKAVDFNTDIKPILTQSCVKCHRQDQRNPRGPAGGLRLDDKAAAMKGGKSGVAIVEGKSADSLLFKVLSGPVKGGEHDVSAMPKPGKNQEWKALPKEKVDLIGLWIDQGAKWGG
jgi:hypothetical protein